MHSLSQDFALVAPQNDVNGCTYKGSGYITPEGVEWTKPPEYNEGADIEDNSCSWYNMFFGCADPDDPLFEKVYHYNENELEEVELEEV